MSSRLEQQLLEAYDAHADHIFRFCYAQCGDREAACDLTQETFVRMWKYLASGKRIEKPKPFLYRTARNAAIDRQRTQRTTSLEQLRESGFDRRDERTLGPDTVAEASRAVQLVATLEPAYREAVALRYLDELPPRDIAKILRISENNVSVRINRGMQQLRTLLGISDE